MSAALYEIRNRSVYVDCTRLSEQIAIAIGREIPYKTTYNLGDGLEIMKQLIAFGVAALLGFSAPAFAQTAGAQSVTTPAQGSSNDGLTALNQAPPPVDNTALLIGGGVAIGAGALIAVVVSNNKNDDTTTTPPVSP
jgi:hypothetical protein